MLRQVSSLHSVPQTMLSPSSLLVPQTMFCDQALPEGLMAPPLTR